jgi:hypothetical protein
VRGSRVEKSRQYLQAGSFIFLTVGSLLRSIHLHVWAPSQGGGLPWRWTLRYSVSVKEGKNLHPKVDDWY